ncbi:MAG TPA: Plug domain-containing protein [Gemmatimonadales bacterium]
MTAVHRGLVWSLSLVSLTGCIHPRPMRSGDTHGERTVLTEEQIARSGGSNAWDVLKRLAPQFSFSEDRNGQPRRLERRGRSSILLSDAPLVFVDGTEMADFKSLIQVPATTLASIEILGSIDGTTYYGSNAVGGVILIHTKNGS